MSGKEQTDNQPNKEAAAKVPIWHSPSWIAAIVAIVSAFLTVPQVVSDYLTGRQEIRTSELSNQFETVQRVLDQNGKERIFLLRYLSETLENEKTRVWAEGELKKLEDTTNVENSISDIRREIRALLAQVNDESFESDEILELIDQLEAERRELRALYDATGVSGETIIWTVGNAHASTLPSLEGVCSNDGGTLNIENSGDGTNQVSCIVMDTRGVVERLLEFVARSELSASEYLSLAEKYNLVVPNGPSNTVRVLGSISDPRNIAGNSRIVDDLGL